ncbi:uncharacterized protein LOC122575439 isoform X9 [Bombus pyrosoma]|uniref:uncharacterized protein LOC122575439 isoform X9 n=1 Tax=Bombus pyrosoma TaxID=396416 RepID=UPI001CB8D087|nr:uncharacterized protein LOC122575439 isoform X9 [Bombus pyrosoma]
MIYAIVLIYVLINEIRASRCIRVKQAPVHRELENQQRNFYVSVHRTITVLYLILCHLSYWIFINFIERLCKVAPIFSVTERKANPRISIFAYPTMRRIGQCAGSQEANGYLCCAFAGTEYLLGQATFPDFCLTVWQWKTGERLTKINGTDMTMFDIDRTRLVCSTDSTHLVARFLPSTGTLSVYRVLTCSDTVRLFPMEVHSERTAVSCSWSTDGTLLCCDESGTVWSVDFEQQVDPGVRTIVRRLDEDDGTISPRRNPTLVGHGDGTLVVDGATHGREVRATFYRKLWKDQNEEWRPAWTISLPSYPRHAESDPSQDRILMLGEDGDLFEIIGLLHHCPPRLEFLLRDDTGYANIAALHGPYLGALDQTGRLAVIDVATAELASPTIQLTHHGKVADFVSHPVLPILVSCSVTGNCLFIEWYPTLPVRKHCVHLQREALDRVKFSNRGHLLAVASSQIGRLFLLSMNVVELEERDYRVPASKVAAWLNLGRKVIDFLIYEMDQDHAKALLLVANIESSDSRAGDEIIVYSCRLFDRDVHVENADCSIKLLSSFEHLHYGKESSYEIIGVPYLTKQLHRLELKEDFQNALLSEALPSLHQTRSINIAVHYTKSGESSSLFTCGFDGLIVWRDCTELRRVFALFTAHHRSEGGGRRTVLFNNVVVSLGRNGDLVANRLPNRMVEQKDSRGSRSTESYCWITLDDRLKTRKSKQVDATENEETEGTETWMDMVIRQRSMAEEKQALATRLSLLDDWNKLKRRVKALLDSNETEPPNARLPISAFDLDQRGRELALAAARSTEIELTKNAEETISRLNQSILYLRQRFLDPLIVRPRSIFSLFGESKVTNYPLDKFVPREQTYIPPWCQFSRRMRELVSRLEGEENSGTIENPQSRCHGFVDVLETCIITDHQERELKVKFNELFEKTRSTKQREMRAANERSKEMRRLVLELKRVFHVDASAKLFEPPQWHPREIIEDEFERDANTIDDARLNGPERNNENEKNLVEDEVEIETKVDDFREQMLDRMMDGVLEVRLEHNAKRSIPKPDCLTRKDAASYTEEDIRAIESYEKKIRSREVDRQRYKSMLEAEIERISGEFSNSAKSFHDELNELSKEKIQIERSILSQRLSKMQAILHHRKIVQKRRQIRRTIELELVPATKEADTLAEERDLFEAGVAELRTSYENARKRDKQLETKFRSEFAELKPSVPEHLFRQYRKRPRLLTAHGPCGTSAAFLAELAVCIIEQRNSDVLPRECSSYLRAMDELDRLPEELQNRLQPDYWHLLCRLRRLKVEAEIKVKSNAIELAEAEQSLTFLRNACYISRDKVDQCKQKIERLEECIMDCTENIDTTLALKMGQMCIEPNDCPRTYWKDRKENAVSSLNKPMMRVHRTIQKLKIKSVKKIKSSALKEFQIINNAGLYQAHHRECVNRVQNLQKYKGNVQPKKRRRDGLPNISRFTTLQAETEPS